MARAPRLSSRSDSRTTQARELLPEALASVLFGFVLVRVRLRANGACFILFCAANRSDAFPPNMPAGLRTRLSRLGGFTRPLSG